MLAPRRERPRETCRAGRHRQLVATDVEAEALASVLRKKGPAAFFRPDDRARRRPARIFASETGRRGAVNVCPGFKRVANDAYQRSIAASDMSRERTSFRTRRRSSGGIAPGFSAGWSGGSASRVGSVAARAAATAKELHASAALGARKPTEYVRHGLTATP